MAAGLQRSQISFRRQGSSGLVWDDKFLNNLQEGDTSDDASKGQLGGEKGERSAELWRTKSDGGGAIRGGAGGRREVYRGIKVTEAEDPPSPKVAACGFCGVFSKKSQSPAKQGTRSAAAGKIRRKR